MEYSVGAMYVAILNFSRHLQYQKENMILAGIIPGPRKSSLHVLVFGTTCKRFAEVIERRGDDNPRWCEDHTCCPFVYCIRHSSYKEAWLICRSWILEGMFEVSKTFYNR